MDRYAITCSRLALAVVYIWFGALKLTGDSPVADMVQKTAIFLPRRLSVPFMGLWELTIGIGLLLRVALRPTLLLLVLQIAGTFLVVVLHPGEVFRNGNPLVLTERGEFLLKNLVILSAALAVGGKSRFRG
jgi:uncharacterized membrane protein YphA (DoxX/SURF4 family)